MRSTKTCISIVAIIAISAGCFRRPPPLPEYTYDQLAGLAGKQPTEGEAAQAALDFLAITLKDPDSIKQFKVTTTPQPMQWKGGAAWLVCYQYNAKNSYGGYVGLTNDGIGIRYASGKFTQVFVDWASSRSFCPR